MRKQQKIICGYNLSLLLILVLSTLVYQTPFANDYFKGEWIDLSHEYSEETLYWPTEDGFKKTINFEGYNEKGFYYSAYSFTTAEHGGTHIDAPIHFAEGKNTVDKIPLNQLIAPGIVIRVTDKISNNRNYQISIDDIKTWENKHGQIEAGSIVIFDTNSARLWPNREKYMGTAEKGPEAVAHLSFPGIDPKAAQFLASNRHIKAVAIDTPSIDFGGSTHFESHQILFNKNIFGIENITNIKTLPEKGFMIMALPMKIKNGSGGPVRVVAFIPENDDN